MPSTQLPWVVLPRQKNCKIQNIPNVKKHGMQTVTLNNGVEMPLLGLGVYQIDDAECERCVREAIELGYRSVDTAQMYWNEEGVGRAVAGCGVPREELFITTKIWLDHAGTKAAAASIDASLKRLGMDYVDLLLIHQPFNDYYGTWRAMEAALRAGKVRAIGVSNFYPDRLIDLCRFVDICPAVNQVETHVFRQQAEARPHMEKLGVRHEAWGPFAEGSQRLFSNAVLQDIGALHGKTAAQVALRFLIQQGIVAIPKSTHRQRMAENLDVFDFALGEKEMQAIAALDEGKGAFQFQRDPDSVSMLLDLESPASGAR